MNKSSDSSFVFVVEWFYKEDLELGDRLIGQVDVPSLSESMLKKIFELPDDGSPWDGFYLITKKESESLKKFVEIQFNMDKYDYFIGPVQA